MGHLPRAERAGYENWLHQGGLKHLEAVAPAWVEDAGLDTESFRQRNFGPDGSTRDAGLAQNLGRDLRLALANRSAAQARGAAGESLARLVQATPGSRRNQIVTSRPNRPAITSQTGLTLSWTTTMEAALRNPKNTEYDNLIRSELAEYNRRFAGTPGFSPLDFRIFKATLLTESGGPLNGAWVSLPFQIGKPDDPGYNVLRNNMEGSDLVMSDELRRHLNDTAITNPELNVRAGIAYILTRSSRSELRSYVDHTDSTVRQHIVLPGETLVSIAQRDPAASNPSKSLEPDNRQ